MLNLYNGILSSHKENEKMTFHENRRKWELLRATSQMQESKCHVFSHIQNINLKL